ncbi:sigma-70 family RNA polymerase sigma factor [bacterium]|nr:sigma-70 family RNA polymerase sigma factor [bacterium]
MDNPELETDEHLVQNCQAGDSIAFDCLVCRHQKLVFRLIYRIVGKDADIEDIAQEVFLRAYKGLDKFRGDAAFSTWLTRITVNYCLKVFNQRKTKPLLERLTSFIAWSKESTQQSVVELQEQRAVVKQALERLSPKHKAAIVLLYFEEYSCEEIAEILECSVGTVKSRLYHARIKLKKLLSPYFFEGEWNLHTDSRESEDCVSTL